VLAGQTVSGVSNRLLLRVLTSQEEIRQTLKTLSVMMQSVLCRLNLTNGLAAAQLPEGVSFPMTAVDDVDNVEHKLKDSATKTVLVNVLRLFCRKSELVLMTNIKLLFGNIDETAMFKGFHIRQ
jgi:hypothetical protein